MPARAKPAADVEPDEENDLTDLEVYVNEVLKWDGVTGAAGERLKNDVPLVNLMDLAVFPPGVLADAINVDEAVARRIVQGARDRAKVGGFETAKDLGERAKNWRRITTGATDLDSLLGGGVQTCAITEAFGQYSGGKSELGSQLAVNVQLPYDKGGLNGEADGGEPADVFWVDTEATFRASRIEQMARGAGLDPEKVLPRIHVASAFNASHQQLLLDVVKRQAVENDLHPRLIVIDSLTDHFRAEFIGRGTLAARQGQLNDHMHRLLRMAQAFNAAVYVTNQAMSDPSAMFGDATRPIGGNIVGHNATYRLYLRKSKPPKRVARLVDSPDLPDGEASFDLLEEGLRNSTKPTRASIDT